MYALSESDRNNRERQVAKLISEERTIIEISKELCWSISTVQGIVERLAKRLGVRGRVGIAIWYIQNKHK